MSIDITKKIKFLELPQSSYDNLNIKDSYTFYKTENNMYYEDLLLSYYNKIYNYYIAFYSADDNSLNFCGVDEIPAIGTQLLGKIVTTVYQGLDDTSTSTSTIPWYSNRTNFKSVIVDITFSKYQPSSIGLWFYGFTNLTTVDLSFLDTSQTTIMQSMFYNCSSLTSLDLSFLDTSKVTNISYMFYGCSKLTSLDLSNFDSSQVTTMSSMFYNCTSLVTIYSNDSIFVTTKVTSGTNMFASCSKLVGGNGTVYSSSNVSYTMAHVDTASNPGYFTAKNSNSYSNIFSDNTPAQIQEAVNQGIAANLWSVGDTIAIELNGIVGACTFNNETYYAFILGFDHNTDLETNGKHSITLQFGKTTDGIDIAFTDSNYDSIDSSVGFRMNTSRTNSGGWNSSYMKQTICPAFYNALPSDWQDIISTITKYTNNTGSSGNTESKVTATNDEQIFLLAEYEILGSITYGNTYEENYQRQYDYYAAGNNKIKYQHSATSIACAWWSRSAYYYDSISFCFVPTNGKSGFTSSYYSFGLAPAFAIVESSTSNLSGSTSNLSGSNTKKHKIKFLKLSQSSYDNLDIKDSYTFYKTENDMYYEDLLLSYDENRIYNYYIAFYSVDDSSLNFCGVDEIPTTGIQLLGKTVTTVYQGLDSTSTSTSTIPWYSDRTNFKSVIIDKSFINAKPTCTAYWFFSFTNCTLIDGLKYLDTSQVVTMAYMFAGCRGLTSLDLSPLDTSQVTTMSGMFQNCNSLISIDISNFNTSKVNFMSNMFQNCNSLISIDISNFNTSKMDAINYMFDGCSNLTLLDISNFDTSIVTTMSCMFSDCSELTTIYSDDSKFVTTAVTSGTNMFTNCSKLVGGNGTTYSSSKVTYTMAHVDTANNPGYFTAKNNSSYSRASNLGYFTAKNNSSYSSIFSDNTPAQIQTAVSQGIAANLWDVGDSIPITLNGTFSNGVTFDNDVVYAFILGFDHNAELETNGKHNLALSFGKLENGTDIYFPGFLMQDADYSYSKDPVGWNYCLMRNVYCPEFFDCLPDEWQKVVGTTKKYQFERRNGVNEDGRVEYTDDQIFLMSTCEVGYPWSGYVNPEEFDYQQCYDYYAEGNSYKRQKYFDVEELRPSCYTFRSFVDGQDRRFADSLFSESTGDDIERGFAPCFTIIEDSNTKKHKIKFLELSQSSYDNLDTKDSYTFYKTENDLYYENLLLSYIKFNRVFGNNTPDLIKQAVTEGIAQDLWSVGDSIVIKLNGVVGDLTFDNETYYAFILGFDHNTDLETNGKHSLTLGFGKTANEINIAFIDSNYNSIGSSAGFRMNTSSTNKGGWDSSYMKNTICPAFYNALSSDWQNIVGTITKYTDNTGNSSNVAANVTATEDQIFLLAEYEVQGSQSYANQYEQNYQQQYDYYVAGNSKVKYRHSATSSPCNWWSRSATYDSAGSFCYTHTTGTLSYFYVARYSSGFAPAFCIVSDN